MSGVDSTTNMKREDFTRCRFCKELHHDDELLFDAIVGYECPNGVKESFTQPPYESPLQNDVETDTKKL